MEFELELVDSQKQDLPFLFYIKPSVLVAAVADRLYAILLVLSFQAVIFSS